MNYKPNNLNSNNLNNKPIFKVSQLIKQLQQLFEASYREIWVEAELSNFSKPTSGHWYFSLKDEKSQIRCAMFRNRASISHYQPKEGDLVRIRGKITIYPARGDMQLIVDHIEAAGEGALQRQFEALKYKLQQEGIFSQDKKQALPSLAKHIGIVSSPTGAAIQDVLTTLKRRFPSINITLYPAIVQGIDAAESIISALDLALVDDRCDVILLTRGGGSLEDLWCFNDEALTRKIADFNIPIVSAIGHEVDITLSDFAADLRAPTPTAAAELVTPQKQELMDNLNSYQMRLVRTQQQNLNTLAQNIDWLAKRLRHPSATIIAHKKRLMELKQRSSSAIIRRHKTVGTQLNYLYSRLNHLSPQVIIDQKKINLNNANERIKNSITRLLQNKQQQLEYLHNQLESISHQKTLDRGYAMIQDSSNNVISSINQLSIESDIFIKLTDGSAHATIKKTNKY